MDINIKSYGAVGDGRTLCTDQIQNAIDACHNGGGGRVIVSDGIFKTGTIKLKSYVELHITANAVLLGSDDCAHYPENNLRHATPELLPRWRSSCLILADECEFIAITGDGCIDCNGHNFVAEKPETDKIGWTHVRKPGLPTPPRAVMIMGCAHVKIEDITMKNQPAGWSYWIHDCDYVTVDKCKIIADVNYPNNDGIHINCSRDVTVSNCSITCGDDCIIVRANSVSLKENKICERVTVTNCSLTSYSGGIRIGYINDGVIRNCVFSNLVMTDTSVGISIVLPHLKYDPARTDTSDIGREATVIENISFNNIIMDRTCSHPIRIEIEDSTEIKCKALRRLYFSNLHASGPEFIFIRGREDIPIEDISFSDCSFEITDGSEIPNRRSHGACTHYDLRYYPMIVHHCHRLKMNNVEFTVKQ